MSIIVLTDICGPGKTRFARRLAWRAVFGVKPMNNQLSERGHGRKIECRFRGAFVSVQSARATMTLFEFLAGPAGAGRVPADLVRIADRFAAHDVG